MRAGFSFSYPPISLLLGQPLSIKKSYAGAIQWPFVKRGRLPNHSGDYPQVILIIPVTCRTCVIKK
jgi:hypothetical protein